MQKAELSEIASFFHGYLSQIPAGADVLALMAERLTAFQTVWGQVPPAKQPFAYAPGKWTAQQMLQHMIDTERIMAYRALCLARGEQGGLPGFDENTYAEQSLADLRPWPDLLQEFGLVRQSSLALFKGFSPATLLRQGPVSGRLASVRALACVVVGHEMHHSHILQSRYLPV
ncbi:MAG: DinB family protein [Bernardetiaceae bacterium]|jgi:hypothetical protein|nr:DinB family protein [Bernardetiaceae bacterium]